MDSQEINGFYTGLKSNIDLLLAKVPALQSCLKDKGLYAGEDIDVLRKINFAQLNGKPVVLTAMCGPSGAGKSTVFNLITGIKTPAGGAVRPMTYSSLAALPQDVIEKTSKDELDNFFSGFDLQQLENPDDLKQPNDSDKLLFYSGYSSAHVNLGEDTTFCLVDIPDFNTTETNNWAKAEQMLQRADSVLFVVYYEAYKDSKTFDILKRALKLCGSITYLLTKLQPDTAKRDAEDIRNDLIKSAEKNVDFAVKREDGLTLWEKLAEAPFFYSAYYRQIDLNGIYPLANTEKNFTEFLYGQNDISVILSHQKQSISAGVDIARKTCLSAEELLHNTNEQINRIHEQIKYTAEKIAGEKWPIIDMLSVMGKILNDHRPAWYKRAFNYVEDKTDQAFDWVADKVKNIINNKSLPQKEMTLAEAEMKRLKDYTDSLIDEWRSTGQLKADAEACRLAEEKFLQKPLPVVSSKWQNYLEEKILQEWDGKPQYYYKCLTVVKDALKLAGTGLVTTDIFVDGGFGSLGMMSVYAGVSGLQGWLISLLEKAGLKPVADAAEAEWKDTRTKAYFNHIKDNLAEALLLERESDVLQRISEEDIAACRKACDQLDNLQIKVNKPGIDDDSKIEEDLKDGTENTNE